MGLALSMGTFGLVALATNGAQAQDDTWNDVLSKVTAYSTNTADYLTNFALDENQLPGATPTRDDYLRVRTNNTIRYSDTFNDRLYMVEVLGGLYADNYDGRSSLNSDSLWTRGSVLRQVMSGMWLGGGYEFKYRRRDQETQNTSNQGFIDWRYRPNLMYTSRLMLSAENQNYNDFFGTGLDQNQYSANFTQLYYPFEDKTSLLFGLMATRADADADNFSYNRYIFQLRGHYQLDDQNALRAWGRYHDVRYDGQFSTVEPFGRVDHRYEMGAGYRYTFSKMATVFAEFEYIVNDSNTVNNDYDGTRTSVGVELSF